MENEHRANHIFLCYNVYIIHDNKCYSLVIVIWVGLGWQIMGIRLLRFLKQLHIVNHKKYSIVMYQNRQIDIYDSATIKKHPPSAIALKQSHSSQDQCQKISFLKIHTSEYQLLQYEQISLLFIHRIRNKMSVFITSVPRLQTCTGM